MSTSEPRTVRSADVGEHKPDGWHEPELERAFQEDRTAGEKLYAYTFNDFRNNHPKEFAAWSQPLLEKWGRQEADARSAQQQSALIAGLETRLDPARVTTPFDDPGLQATYSGLDSLFPADAKGAADAAATARRYAAAPNEIVPAIVSALTEAKWALQRDDPVTGRYVTYDVRHQEVSDELTRVARALEQWRTVRDGASRPDGEALRAAADECLRRIQDCLAAASRFMEVVPQIPEPMPDPPEFLKSGLQLSLGAVAAEIASQLRSRAGEPSFVGMFDRLSEQPRGDVDPAVERSINDTGGNFRKVWSDGRDALLDTLDRDARRQLRKAFGEDFGPALDDWRDEYKRLDRNYSISDMQKSVLAIAYAAERYGAAVDAAVADPNARAAFHALLDGIQLSIRADVGTCATYLT